MMTTDKNYHDILTTVDVSKLPEVLRKGHEFVRKVTDNGAHWDNYHSSQTIKKTIDAYFQKLDEFIGKSIKADAPAKKAKTKQPSKKSSGTAPKSKKAAQKPASKKADVRQPLMVERIPEELRFIKRFVNLNGKTKTREEILNFINSLQKAIVEKKIRKTSIHADHIRFIQDTLIDIYNTMAPKIELELKAETLARLREIASDEKVMASVGFIKRYINMNGKPAMKEKARLLLGQINRAYEQGKIGEQDPYIVEMHEIKKNLAHFLSEHGRATLEIEKNTLNGLEGILNGCNCHNLNGFDGDASSRKPIIMNSMDFANMRFKSLGFKGKWLQLIGDPSTNFSIMVFGKPKMGKSYLCVDFAGYLARNHGRVLYVAREEGLDKTLQDKLNDKEVKHPNLYVASTLPANLSMYDFIFLDSVNKLGLEPEDLNRLKASSPTKSFIYVFQTTKEGKFRGANTFQHDVDSVIEIPERGRAVQYGRFNQGGEMAIF